MHTTRWNKKRVSIAVIGLFLMYVIFSASNNTFEIAGIIKNTKPEQVWEFVADFNKMRLLNPTIIDFKITADHGNVHHWQYTVVYREKLSHWPYWITEQMANINVKQVNKNHPDHDPSQLNDQYIIESDHKSCFFIGLYCLYAKSEFKFMASDNNNGHDTNCIETINYQCPPFLGKFCRRELEFTRSAVMNNLSIQFERLT